MSEHLLPAALIEDDLLLTALAGGTVGGTVGGADGGPDVAKDELTELLAAWRAELVAATPIAPSLALPSLARRRFPRRAVAAATAVVLVTGGGVAAAAASGPSGPLGGLHRILFGGASTHRAVDADEIRALLDLAGKRIASAQLAGFVTPAARDDIADLLERAAGQLQTDFVGADTLRARLAALRSELAALPNTAPIHSAHPPAPPTQPAQSAQPTGAAPGRHAAAPGGDARESQPGDDGNETVGPPQSEQPTPSAGGDQGDASGDGGGSDDGTGSGTGSQDSSTSQSGDGSGDDSGSGSGSGSQDGSNDGSGTTDGAPDGDG